MNEHQHSLAARVTEGVLSLDAAVAHGLAVLTPHGENDLVLDWYELAHSLEFANDPSAHLTLIELMYQIQRQFPGWLPRTISSGSSSPPIRRGQ
jgi:hypothetical protein